LDVDKIRAKGKALLAFAEELIKIKRQAIEKVLQRMLTLPLAFIGLFVVVIVLISRMTSKDILKPLSMLQTATEKATQGNFGLIPFATDKEDEVSQCVAAFNKMATEIQIRQDQLLQSRKMASIGTFTSGIAHELNNPINNISLIVEALVEDAETMESTERLHLYQDLMEQAERSSEIVKNLLEFSRTDQPRFEAVSMEQLVDKTARLLQNELKLGHIKFSKNVRDKLPPMRVDKSRLQQALLNLLINSVQAIHGRGEIKVDIGLSDHSDEIRIDVIDTGKGIPSEHLDSIFDPFFTTKKEGEGTGLGLALSYSIIEKHGGRIEVKSTPGKGTCFSIFLPLGADHAPKTMH
jgi:two-component system NtrC family sensor kinase